MTPQQIEFQRQKAQARKLKEAQQEQNEKKQQVIQNKVKYAITRTSHPASGFPYR